VTAAPHDLEAERAILGTLLSKADLVPRATRRGVTARSFYGPFHGRVYAAILALAPAADIVTVHELLRRGTKAEPDDLGNLAHLTEWAAAPENLDGRCDLLVRLERQRELIALTRSLDEAAHATDDPIALSSEFSNRLRDLSSAGSTRSGLLEAIHASTALTAADLPRPVSLLGDGLICRGDLVIFAGQPGLGKSRLSLEMAVAMAKGEPWMGLATADRPLRVCYLALEFSNYRWLERCLSIFGDGSVHAESSELLGAYRDLTLSGPGGCFHWLTRQQLDGGLDLVSTAGALALRHLIDALTPDLVICDALSRCLGNREETNEEFGPFIENCDDIRYSTGAALEFIHHERKVEDRSKTDRLSMIRGGSKLTAAANTVLTCSKTPSGLRAIYFDKANYAREPEPIHYEIPEEGGPTMMVRAPEKRGDQNVEAVWQAIRTRPEGATAKDIADATKLSLRLATKHLARLKERGVERIRLDFRTWSYRVEERAEN
jgi:DNA-binding MarR family transcriptional regulator